MKKIQAYIGIDPGQTGAIACYIPDQNGLIVFDYENMNYSNENMELILKMYPRTIAVLESVHAMPKQGVSSSFNFGVNFGFWQGLLVSHKVPFNLVTPQRWQKRMLKKNDGKDTKDRSLNVARRLFPNDAEYFKRKKDNGRSDAALMAVYAHRL